MRELRLFDEKGDMHAGKIFSVKVVDRITHVLAFLPLLPLSVMIYQVTIFSETLCICVFPVVITSPAALVLFCELDFLDFREQLTS